MTDEEINKGADRLVQGMRETIFDIKEGVNDPEYKEIKPSIDIVMDLIADVLNRFEEIRKIENIAADKKRPPILFFEVIVMLCKEYLDDPLMIEDVRKILFSIFITKNLTKNISLGGNA